MDFKITQFKCITEKNQHIQTESLRVLEHRSVMSLTFMDLVFFFLFLSLHALYLSQYFTSGEKCSPPLLSKASCVWFSFIYLLTPPQSGQGAILSPAELIRRWLHLSRCISHSPSPHISSVALLGAVTAVSRFPNKNRQASFIYTARLIRRVIQGALCKRHRRKIIRRNVRR